MLCAVIEMRRNDSEITTRLLRKRYGNERYPGAIGAEGVECGGGVSCLLGGVWERLLWERLCSSRKFFLKFLSEMACSGVFWRSVVKFTCLQ